MSEAMARVLGAAGPLMVKIGGKDCSVRPLTMRELTEIERDCVQRYKRQYLETFAKNLDLLFPETARTIMQDKMSEVARWDAKDLPSKFVYDPDKIKLTDGLKKWLAEFFDVSEEEQKDRTDEQWRRMTAVALDQELMSTEKYAGLSGHNPRRVRVNYISWWVTGAYEGMVTYAWACFRQNGVTREQVEDAMGERSTMLVEITRELDRLSKPQASNG